MKRIEKYPFNIWNQYPSIEEIEIPQHSSIVDVVSDEGNGYIITEIEDSINISLKKVYLMIINQYNLHSILVDDRFVYLGNIKHQNIITNSSSNNNGNNINLEINSVLSEQNMVVYIDENYQLAESRIKKINKLCE